MGDVAVSNQDGRAPAQVGHAAWWGMKTEGSEPKCSYNDAHGGSMRGCRSRIRAHETGDSQGRQL